MVEPTRIVARAHAALGAVNYKVDLQAGRHTLTVDEPAMRGGADAGPDAHEMVLSGLAACTAITLRMFAERKGWTLRAVDVDARLSRTGEHARIDRTVAVQGELTSEQKAQLLEAAEETPVTLMLKGGIEILTTLR